MKTAHVRLACLALACSLLGVLALAQSAAAQHLPDPPMGTSASAPTIEPLPGVDKWTNSPLSRPTAGWFVHHPQAGLMWLILAPEGTAVKSATFAPSRRIDARLQRGRTPARNIR